jgi:hypothetical protein
VETVRLEAAGDKSPRDKSRRVEKPRPAAGQALEIWAFDEHRLGLKPVIRRVWAKKGQRPVAVSSHKYEWLYLYAFVRPATGEVVWWIANTVNVALFQSILDAFAKERSLAEDKPAVLLIDNAGWHHGKDLEFPDGLHPCYLPAYTPELQPAERLWTLTDEPIANKSFESLEVLAEVLAERCRTLSNQPERIKASTLFSWWPAE